MVESYTVSATLEVKDLLSAALRRASQEARTLFEALEKLKGGDAMGATGSALARLNDAMGAGAAAGARMGDAIARGADVAMRGLSGAADQAERLERAMNAVSRMQGRTPSSSSSAPSATPVIWRPGAQSTPAPANNNARPGSLNIPPVPPFAQSHYNVHTGTGGGSGGGGDDGSSPVAPAAGRPSRALDAWGMLASGQMIAGYGASMLRGVGDTLGAGGDLLHQQNLLRIALGTSPTANADYATATQAAAAVAKENPSINLAAATALVSEAYSVTGNMGEAAALSPGLAHYSIIASADAAGGHKVDAYTAMRAAELGGWTVNPVTHQIDPQRTQEFFGDLERMTVMSHGRVNDQSLFNFYQTAGQAAKNLTSDALLQLAPVIAEFGGFRAGTALTSLNQQVRGGVMPQRVVADWEKLGLIDPTKVSATRTGVRLEPGAVQNASLLATNPIGFIESVLVPAMQKAGFSPQQMQDEVMRLMSRGTSQRLVGALISQSGQYNKDFAMEQQALSTDAAKQLLNGGDYNQNLSNLTGSLATLSEVLGKDVMPTAIPAIQALTSAIQYLTAAATAHPEAAKIIVGLAAGLGGLAVVGGTAIATIAGVSVALRGLGILGAAARTGAVGAAGLAVDGIAAIANPIGAAIAAGFVAYLGFKGLDALIQGSAPPNTGAPRTGYHPANEAKVKVGDGSATQAPENVRHDGVGRGVQAQSHLVDAVAAGVAKGLNGAAVNADGAKIATLVTRHQANAAKAPPRGRSAFDDRAGPSWPGHAVVQR